MAQPHAPTGPAEISTVLGDVVRDGAKLVRQQVELFRAEAGQELRQVVGSGGRVAGGLGLTAAGGLMGGLMMAHLLHRASGLPLWTCYGLAAAGAGGVYLMRTGARDLVDVRFSKTTEALKENVAWLSEQTTPAAE